MQSNTPGADWDSSSRKGERILAQVMHAPCTAADIVVSCGCTRKIAEAWLRHLWANSNVVRMARGRDSITKRPCIIWGLAGRDKPAPELGTAPSPRRELIPARADIKRPQPRVRVLASNRTPAPYARGYRWGAGE